MVPFTKRFPLHCTPTANPKAVVTEGDLRITVLTSRCLRIEWDSARTFEDRPSQTFWYREQPVHTRNAGLTPVFPRPDYG